MRHRYDRVNVPTELARALVLVSEAGSFTRAAETLGLTQPAMTAQIKRLEGIVGSPLLERSAGGVELTQMGRLVLDHARGLLEANDRIMALAGAGTETQVRIGVAQAFLEPFLREFIRDAERPGVQIKCLPSNAIGTNLADGHLDVALLLVPDASLEPIVAWREAMSWVQAPGFAIDTGRPIPLIAWPSKLADILAYTALERHGLDYAFVLVSPDIQCRITATRLGFGVTALLGRSMVDVLEPVPAGVLPAIPPVRVGICLRRGLRERDVAPITAAMRRAFAAEIAASGA